MKITVGFVRDILHQLDSEEISISRFVELLNQKAFEEPTIDKQILINANTVLRSCNEVVSRRGADTNWMELNAAIYKALIEQHPFLNSDKNVKVSDTTEADSNSNAD